MDKLFSKVIHGFMIGGGDPEIDISPVQEHIKTLPPKKQQDAKETVFRWCGIVKSASEYLPDAIDRLTEIIEDETVTEPSAQSESEVK